MKRLLAILAFAMLPLPSPSRKRQAKRSQLFQEREFRGAKDPLAATGDGVHDFDDRLPSVTHRKRTARWPQRRPRVS